MKLTDNQIVATDELELALDQIKTISEAAEKLKRLVLVHGAEVTLEAMGPEFSDELCGFVANRLLDYIEKLEDQLEEQGPVGLWFAPSAATWPASKPTSRSGR